MSGLAMETRLTGKHVLFFVLAFFAVIGAVNAAFVYLAVSSKPGEERGASYETGLRYNTILAEERNQQTLHWRHQTEVAQGDRLRVAITDKEGGAVAGLALAATVGRPASETADQSLAFKEIDTGVYEALLGKISRGSWVLAFTAQKPRAGDAPAVYRVKERLWLSPAH